MDTKLTLKLDKNTVEGAKEYASAHNKSLSRLIESYLKSLLNSENPGSENEIEISPFVKSLRTGVKLPSDYDYRKEYGDYLMEKFK